MDCKKGAMVFIAVFTAGIVWAREPVDCVYRARNGIAGSSNSVQEYKNCGTKVDGKVVLGKKHLRRLHYDKYGLATILLQNQYYYVKRTGSMLPVVAYDNWADDYSEGLVRSAVDGKIAFYDKKFHQIIAPKHDWAGPFKKGRALVCKGCRAEKPDEEGHTALTGGLWGYIDKKGQEVVPVKHARAEAEKME